MLRIGGGLRPRVANVPFQIEPFRVYRSFFRAHAQRARRQFQHRHRVHRSRTHARPVGFTHRQDRQGGHRRQFPREHEEGLGRNRGNQYFLVEKPAALPGERQHAGVLLDGDVQRPVVLGVKGGNVEVPRP